MINSRKQNKILKKLKSNKGDITITSVGLFMFSMVILALLVEVFSASVIKRGIRDSIEQAIISNATNNYYYAYQGVREESSSTHQKISAESLWDNSATTHDVTDRLVALLKLNKQGNSYIKSNSSNTYEFAISNITIIVDNPQVGEKGVNVIYETTYDLSIPFSIAGFTMYINSSHSKSSTYRRKF